MDMLEEIWEEAFINSPYNFENIKESEEDDGRHYLQITRCTDEGIIVKVTVSLPGHDSVSYYCKKYFET